ncbi:aspartate/glutamate racemase family protein [Aliiroseovarius subalbicans]|uniref:maleate cis-trans isomerase family protein n=1 Tax=Aliiroseovarius subalbicans TaxID=2925840 RepID=UPI001F5AE99F|nr:aspartate/glutamate racemase family protein [Aliiroseovarius subalbicans]MCI2399629.1 aspartate/glutamate racemase family protein [Aliiroseovarius subalbicans]
MFYGVGAAMKLPFDTDDGIGTRATLGVIVLETDETLEPEFARMTDLEGVALYHSRIPMVAEVRPDTLAQMEADLPAAAKLLPPWLEFDVIGYGCTSASSVIGSHKVAQAIQSVFPRARVTDPLAAIIAAGRSLGAARLGFVTPYVANVSARMRGRLEDAGFAIAGFGSFEEGNDRVVARITEAAISEAAQQVAGAAPCDAVVISCTNLRCLRIIPEIEARIGVPVISSNQALAWHMLRLAGVEASLPQFGQLFEQN